MLLPCQVTVINPAQFAFFSTFLQKHSGYQLEPKKQYMLEARLSGIMKMGDFQNIQGLIENLVAAPHGDIAQKLLQAMTINETTFFRDNTPFDQLRNNILPALATTTKDREISIWSAACSSGQEAYSIAMTIEEERHKYPGFNFKVYGTDLSEDMVKRAKDGIYSDFETSRGLSEDRRKRHFTKEDNSDKWRINDKLRQHTHFEAMNLFKMKPNIGPFDIVFCRNVLIYFDEPQKIEILNHIRKLTRANGYLITGASEVLGQYTNQFKLLSDAPWRNVYKAT